MVGEPKYCPVCATHLVRKAGARKYCLKCKAYFYIAIEGMSVESPLFEKDNKWIND